MAFIFFMTLPGLVVLLTVAAFVDQAMLRAGRAGMLPWRGAGRQGQVASTGFELLHATLSAGKQEELKQRRTSLALRDEEGDGAPPRSRIDLDGGTAVLRIPPS
ncbi:DUF6191 domain-containing protein [Streptomyces sp. RKAG293]|uniref:DUF6191 domain-containing protein n=1 Tax=Streptomyces sp. RKAG293 TaxID=2893403 RepID=UPI0020339278|nr:DUF6191 domain-containing protein [Streptomyces sp. RKAG293]MCM2420191.1 DUF6191 domain-containing protein [Streptomyces sp. RKAG293]